MGRPRHRVATVPRDVCGSVRSFVARPSVADLLLCLGSEGRADPLLASKSCGSPLLTLERCHFAIHPACGPASRVAGVHSAVERAGVPRADGSPL